MSIGAVGNIASSGMTLQTQRAQVSANNMANVNTDGFKPSRVESQPVEDGAGVKGEVTTPQGPPAAIAIQNGQEVALSSTNVATEMVTQLSAEKAYKANANVLRTADEMMGTLLDIGG